MRKKQEKKLTKENEEEMSFHLRLQRWMQVALLMMIYDIIATHPM